MYNPLKVYSRIGKIFLEFLVKGLEGYLDVLDEPVDCCVSEEGLGKTETFWDYIESIRSEEINRIKQGEKRRILTVKDLASLLDDSKIPKSIMSRIVALREGNKRVYSRQD